MAEKITTRIHVINSATAAADEKSKSLYAAYTKWEQKIYTLGRLYDSECNSVISYIPEERLVDMDDPFSLESKICFDSFAGVFEAIENKQLFSQFIIQSPTTHLYLFEISSMRKEASKEAYGTNCYVMMICDPNKKYPGDHISQIMVEIYNKLASRFLADVESGSFVIVKK